MHGLPNLKITKLLSIDNMIPVRNVMGEHAHNRGE